MTTEPDDLPDDDNPETVRDDEASDSPYQSDDFDGLHDDEGF